MKKSNRNSVKTGGRARAGGSSGRGAAAGPRPSHRPLSVTQGANTNADPYTVGLHWITATAPMTHVELARDILDKFVGGESSPSGGGSFYRHSVRWDAGSVLMLDHVNEDVNSCMVKVPGAVLDQLGWEKSCELLDALIRAGFRCTRLDVFVDARAGQWRDLQAQILHAWQSRQICGIKAPPLEHVQHRLDGQIEHTVCLGRRGKQGSGRYLRVYDKGFEDATQERQGEHVRWEAELSDDCAQDAAVAIMKTWQNDDDDDDGSRAAAGIALACVDFREATGRTELAKRPRLAWWDDVVKGLNLLRVVAERSASTLEGYVKHVRQAVLPKLCRMAGVERIADVGRDLASVVAVLQLLGVEGVRASKGDAVTWAFDRGCVPI